MEVEVKMDDVAEREFLTIQTKLPGQIVSNPIKALQNFASEALNVSVKFEKRSEFPEIEVEALLVNGESEKTLGTCVHRNEKLAKEQLAKDILKLLSNDEKFLRECIAFARGNEDTREGQ
eukprot:TRINITY_DN4522_c0_g1_i2.p1 TRINITY_DN4522_c0_g1~~TRINITY_DN4522_c0_g1_i2.p1  ORF type:complete len:136 (+),score=44.69 TRINITY_DN4522_c0_g1_i2:50-409(+)